MTAAQPDLFTRRVRRAPPAPEVKTHVAVADTLRRFCEPDWLWTHIGHGGYRTKATAGLLARMDLRPGWPDFVLVSPSGAHFYLEAEVRRSIPIPRATYLRQGHGRARSRARRRKVIR